MKIYGNIAVIWKGGKYEKYFTYASKIPIENALNETNIFQEEVQKFKSL